MKSIADFIATVGFPIVAYILLFWELRNDRKQNTELWAKVLNHLTENTKALERLSDLIEKILLKG